MTRPLLIAQNLNASDPAVHDALASGDARWIREVARRIESTGVDLIDLNAGTMGASEGPLLAWLVSQVGPLVRCPLSLDSARAGLLLETAPLLPGPGLLNSFTVDEVEDPQLLARVRDSGHALVVSLRREGELPVTSADRFRLADTALELVRGAGIEDDRVFLDAIALPWHDDVEAGRPVLEFVAECRRRGLPRTLVGLGNLGHGHPEAARIHREWMGRLCDVGIGAALVDAFDPGLRDGFPPPC